MRTRKALLSQLKRDWQKKSGATRGAFKVNAKDKRILDERKADIEAGLAPVYQPQSTRPVIEGASTRFKVAGRVQAVIEFRDHARQRCWS